MKSFRPTRVLFVCIGNCCRSQMAEAFARSYGGRRVVSRSAGLAPAGIVVPETIQIMAEKNIDVSRHFSKPFDVTGVNEFDLVVNMSGCPLPQGIRVPVLEWNIADPIGQPLSVYRHVRDHIEGLVAELIARLHPRRARLQR